MILGPQDLLILRNDIVLQISNLFVAVNMKKALFFVDKKILKDLFGNLIFWLNSLIQPEQLMKVFGIVIGSLMYFSPFLIMDGVSLFLCFIDTRDLIHIQVFLISLMFSLKNLVKYFFCPFEQCGPNISVGLVIIMIKFFMVFGFHTLQILSIYYFSL